MNDAWICRVPRWAIFGLLSVFCVCGTDADEPVNFAQDVVPIFSEHCLGCHSPGINKGGVSLATFQDLLENQYVVRGDPDSSYLVELVTQQDGERPEMPKDGDALSDEQVDVLRRWISQGARWPDSVVIREKSKADTSWWSLQRLQDPFDAVAKPTENVQQHERIDSLIQSKLDGLGLHRNPAADRRTLIRRATYDLLGLPPTPTEVTTFCQDQDPDAYEKLIDRLLASPHYGERWGRHWLDVVRFGESNGFERNVLTDSLWPFRDYVIHSINEDKPFDLLIREHLAGDVFGANDPQVAIGSAFLVAGPYDNVGNQDAAQAAQIRADTIDEMIRATSEAFLGITVGCARCHDHKFDAIRQEDYYAMYATFAGVRHGNATLATSEQRQVRSDLLAPLNQRKSQLEREIQSIEDAVLERAQRRLTQFEKQWTRRPVQRTGTEETFAATMAKYVRLVCESSDSSPESKRFRMDEFEIWSAESASENVALASKGGTATGKARVNEDFPGVYGAHLVNDGKTGERFISATDTLSIELREPTLIHRVVFSSARGEDHPEHSIFGGFPADYRIEISLDNKSWSEVAHGRNRQPANQRHRDHRLVKAEMQPSEQGAQRAKRKLLAGVVAEIAKVPALPRVWIGSRNADDATGPFHLFVGGNPQRPGNAVVPASLSTLANVTPPYLLTEETPESQRRVALADWITDPDNPLAVRVLANRIWHYHFGTGIVDTPSDLGYMGGRPTHPELLDYLAIQLRNHNWRLKPLHRMIMLSETYRQASRSRTDAAKIDGDARMLWRFPPRRLSAEEVRDTMLQVSGSWTRQTEKENVSSKSAVSSAGLPLPHPMAPDGGPGFRLYRYMQDNVSTYSPLDTHGSDTYRRAVYHQNARASVVDLMSEFDQPDCAFSSPRRAQTTTPLQALTMLNHSFTLDMAQAMEKRLRSEAGEQTVAQIGHAYQLCYSRAATSHEIKACREFVAEHGLVSLCRVLLNTSELIYVR